MITGNVYITSVSLTSESIRLSNIRTSRVCFNSIILTPGYMPYGRTAGQNIEHPRTLAILSSFFFFASNAF